MKDEIFNTNNAVLGSGTWFKFKNIGDKVGGTFITCEKQADEFNAGKFKNIVSLETENGLVNVSLKDNSYFNYNISKMKQGDLVGFNFDKTVPGKAGMQPAKSIVIYHKPVAVNVFAKDNIVTGGIEKDFDNINAELAGSVDTDPFN